MATVIHQQSKLKTLCVFQALSLSYFKHSVELDMTNCYYHTRTVQSACSVQSLYCIFTNCNDQFQETIAPGL